MASKTHIREIFIAAALASPLVLMPGASASPKDASGEHKVEICHVTNSAKNPFVVISVDVSAFDGEGKNDHTQHLNKDGLADKLAVDGKCDGGTVPTPVPTPTPVP